MQGMLLGAHALTIVTSDANITSCSLSKGRKRRPVPAGWVTSGDISGFDTTASSALPVSQTTSIDLEGGFAALGGLKGEAAIYSIEADKLERQLPVNEAVTNTLWAETKLFFATSQGNVKVYEAGNEVASLSEHAGPVTSLSIHPGAGILGSVGADKSIVFYDLTTMKRASRAFADACKSCPSFVDVFCVSLLTDPCSPDYVRISPRRTSLCRRYRKRRYQTLHDQDAGASCCIQAWCSRPSPRVFRKRLLAGCYSQGPDDSHNL